MRERPAPPGKRAPGIAASPREHGRIVSLGVVADREHVVLSGDDFVSPSRSAISARE
jgi:hypothetical protein